MSKENSKWDFAQKIHLDWSTKKRIERAKINYKKKMKQRECVCVYVCMCIRTWDCEQETSNYSRIFVLEVSMRRECIMSVAWTWTGEWHILYYIKRNRYCLNKIDIHNPDCVYVLFLPSSATYIIFSEIPIAILLR